MDYPVCSTEQVDIGMVLQAGLPWEGDISVEEAQKYKSAVNFWEVLKLFENWSHFVLNILNLEFLNSLKDRGNLILKI